MLLDDSDMGSEIMEELITSLKPDELKIWKEMIVWMIIFWYSSEFQEERSST
jgi:hypothetical protein